MLACKELRLASSHTWPHTNPMGRVMAWGTAAPGSLIALEHTNVPLSQQTECHGRTGTGDDAGHHDSLDLREGRIALHPDQ